MAAISPPTAGLPCCARQLTSSTCARARRPALPTTVTRPTSSTSVLDLVRQRVYGLCGGYEDLADHNRLRSDPLLGMLLERSDGSALGSAATLCRLENSRPAKASEDRYRRIAANFAQLDDLLVEVFLESYPAPPARIVLDIDATDVKLPGKQEGRFFHGYCDSYCYLVSSFWVIPGVAGRCYLGGLDTVR